MIKIKTNTTKQIEILTILLFVFLISCGQASATIQNISITSDVFINTLDNDGQGFYEYVSVSDTNMPLVYKSLFHASIVGYIPDGATINSASLYAKKYNCPTCAGELIHVYQATSGWDEYTDYFPSYGSSMGSTAITGDGWYSFNITTAVNNWVNKNPVDPNYGVALAFTSTTNKQVDFYSRQASSYANHPYLSINYSANTAPSVPVVASHLNYSYNGMTQITWSASTDNESDSIYYNYKIGTSSGGIQVYNSSTPYPYSNNFYMTNPATYYYSVQSCDTPHNVCSAWSAEKVFYYSTNDVPTVPVLVHHSDYVAQAPTQVQFTNSTDNESNPINYTVRVGTSSGSNDIFESAPIVCSEPYCWSEIFNMVPANTYYWTVKACDASGCSAWATEESFTYIGTGSIAETNGTSNIYGVVYTYTDSQYLPVSGADVFLVDTGYTQSRTMTTNDSGYYWFTNLTNDTSYILTAKKTDKFDDSEPYFFTTGLGTSYNHDIKMVACTEQYRCYQNQILTTVLVKHSSSRPYGTYVTDARINFTVYRKNTPEIQGTTDSNGYWVGYLTIGQLYSVSIIQEISVAGAMDPSGYITYTDTTIVDYDTTMYPPNAVGSIYIITVDELEFVAPNVSITPYPNVSQYENRDSGYPSVFDDFNSTSMESSIGLGVMGQSIIVGMINWIMVGAGGMLATFFMSGILIYLGVLSTKTVLFFAITGVSLWYITRT